MDLTPSQLFLKRAITAADADFLVGRVDLVKAIGNRIAEDNKSSCVIYGLRGVGKTSIAWQVASVLSGENKRFKRDEFLKFGRGKQFVCAVHRCSESVETVGELFIDILTSQNGEMRFNRVFASVFADAGRRTSVETKFGVDIFKFFQASETEKTEISSPLAEARTHLKSEDDKIQLFYAIVEEIKFQYKHAEIILVIDEMERPKSITGLGNILKDMDNLQFLFVGIGETIESLIQDHKSAPRKLSGNDFEAPLLSSDEIREVFLIAQRKSMNRMAIEDEFINLAIEYSGGVPWIAQHSGYEAAFAKWDQSPGSQIRLTKDDFEPALKTAIRAHLRDVDLDAIRQMLRGWGETEYETLLLIWASPSGITEDGLRKSISSNYKGFFDRAITRISESPMIRKRGPMLTYADPALRLFVKLEIDNLRA